MAPNLQRINLLLISNPLHKQKFTYLKTFNSFQYTKCHQQFISRGELKPAERNHPYVCSSRLWLTETTAGTQPVSCAFISRKYKNSWQSSWNCPPVSRIKGTREWKRERDRIVLVSSRKHTGVALSRARLAIHSRHGCYCRGSEGWLHLARWQHNGNNNN